MPQSPLARLNEGLIRGFALGQQGLRTQRQLEADKSLRELQERRIGIEEEGLKLRKRQVNISERSALANLIKIPNPKTRKLAVKAFLRGKDVPVAQEQSLGSDLHSILRGGIGAFKQSLCPSTFE